MNKTFLVLAILFFLGFLGLGFWANDKVDSMPPVLQAVIENDKEKLKRVIKQGGDVNAKGPLGMTALVVAVKKGKLELVKLLVEHNADTNIHVSKMSLIEFAAKHKQAEIGAFLREIK